MTAPVPDRAALAAVWRAAIAKRDAESPRARRAHQTAVVKLEQLERNYHAQVEALSNQIQSSQTAIDSLERDVAIAENTLRASADPRIALLSRQLAEWWDSYRQTSSAFDSERPKILAAMPRIKKAHEELAALELDPTADVGGELRRILAATEVTPNELRRVVFRRLGSYTDAVG